MNIIELNSKHREIVNGYVKCMWAGPMIVTRGEIFDTRGLPGFVALDEGAFIGASLMRFKNGECEVCALFTLIQRQGAGTMLLDAAVDAAKRGGARRLWLVTTNDNMRAIRFYQKYGLSLKTVHIGAMEAARKLKGGIPALGEDGIPLLHEFEFELLL